MGKREADRMRKGPIKFFCLLLIASASVLGCGSPTAIVTGKVTYKGKPVTSGVVVFIDDGGRATLPANVRADGAFDISRAFLGRARVSFDNLAPPPLPKIKPGSPLAEDAEFKQMAAAVENYTATPPKYKDPTNSGIVFDLKPGRNECNIDLE
jgi:hypothetical protein